MLNINTIEQEILDLEKRDTSYTTVERLAWLYVVRDHMIKEVKHEEDRVRSINNSSEFLKAVNGVEISAVMSILNEHMEAVKILYPKEYAAVIDKIIQLNP